MGLYIKKSRIRSHTTNRSGSFSVTCLLFEYADRLIQIISQCLHLTCFFTNVNNGTAHGLNRSCNLLVRCCIFFRYRTQLGYIFNNIILYAVDAFRHTTDYLYFLDGSLDLLIQCLKFCLCIRYL